MLRTSNNIKINTLLILKRCANKLFYARCVCALCSLLLSPIWFSIQRSIPFLFCISPIRKLYSTEEEKTTFFSALVQPHTNMNIIRCFVRCFRFTLYGYYHTLTIWVRVFISNSHNVSSCCSCLTHFFRLCYHHYDCNHKHCSDGIVNCCCCSHTLLLFQIYRIHSSYHSTTMFGWCFLVVLCWKDNNGTCLHICGLIFNFPPNFFPINDTTAFVVVQSPVHHAVHIYNEQFEWWLENDLVAVCSPQRLT